MPRLAATFALLCAIVIVAPPSTAQEQKKDAGLPEPIIMKGFGLISGAYLYHTHQQLGYLADAVLKGAARDEDVRNHIRITQALANITDKQLGDIVDNAKMDEDDRKAIQDIRKINGLLGDQSKELLAYAESMRKAHLDKFQEHRAESWRLIGKALKLDEKGKSVEKKVKIGAEQPGDPPARTGSDRTTEKTEPNPIEKLFREAERKVAQAQTARFTSRGHVEMVSGDMTIKVNYKVNIFTAQGNKSRVEDIAWVSGPEKMILSISDGETWWKIPSDPTRKSSSKAPGHLYQTLTAAAMRCGVSLGYAWTHDFASGSANWLDEVKLSEFSLGRADSINQRDARVIHYKMAFRGTSFNCQVWLDSETNLPVKRIVNEVRLGGRRWMETCEFRLNEKLDAKLFETPR